MSTFKTFSLSAHTLAVVLCCAHISIAATTIKFATLAPEGSTWMQVMRELDAELQKKTAGEIKFKIYPGGISGDEKDVVKKIRINQLHAAGFTGVGLGEIAPELRVFDAPWLFSKEDQVAYARRKVSPQLQGALNKAGYILLGWTDLGFVYIFSKNKISGPSDIKKTKIWVWEGDPIAQAAFSALEVNPIPLSVVDVMSALQTGLIDAVYGPPLGVLALQWFARTKYIYAMPLAYATGAVLISNQMFSTLSADQQKILLTVSAKHLNRLNELTSRDNVQALISLQKQGLILSPAPSAQDTVLYSKLGRQARRTLTGKLYSEEILDKIESIVRDTQSEKN